MIASPNDTRPRSRPARELADIRGKNSLQALPARRVGTRKIRPQRTNLSEESGVVGGGRPGRSAGWTYGNDSRTVHPGAVSRRPVGGSTGWDPASYNVNRGRAPVHERLLAKHMAMTPDEDDMSGPWDGPGTPGDSEVLGFEEGSLEAQLEQAGTVADAEAADAERQRAVSRRSARSRRTRRAKGRAASPSRSKLDSPTRTTHNAQVVDLKLDPARKDVSPQGTLWDAPSPLRVPAPSARLYTGTKHTRKWASATAPNTRHVATSPELRGTARRLPSTPSDRELRRRAKQDYRSQQGLDSPSGRRSATFGRNTPTVDDGDDVAPAANLVRFADATGDAHASDDAPAASPAAGATEQSSKVTGTAVTATETRVVQTTTVESSTTVARTTVMHSHNEAGSMVTTRTAATNSAAPNFVVDERPPQKHTWFVPTKDDLVEREPPPPLLLWPGRVRVQRLNLITDGDVTGSGKSPLHLAALLGRADLVKRFLANHNAAAIVDCRDDDENTSLHLVSATTHETAVEIVDLLVEYGADLNAKNKLGWQALHYAAGAANLPVMEALLKHGANVNGGTNNKTTALALCSMSGNEEAVRLLVRYGADMFVCDYLVRTPVYFAAVSSHDEIADVIQAAQRKRLVKRKSEKQIRRMRRDLVRLGFHDRLPKPRPSPQPSKVMIRHMWSKGMRPQSVATARPSTRASYGRRGPLASPMTTTRGSLPTHFLDEAGHQGDRFDRLAVSLDFGEGSTDTSTARSMRSMSRGSLPDLHGGDKWTAAEASHATPHTLPSLNDDTPMQTLRRSASSRSAPGMGTDRQRPRGPRKPGLLDDELELALHTAGADLLDPTVRTARSALV